MHVRDCTMTDGTQLHDQDAYLTYAYSAGRTHGSRAEGAACVISAIESNTGVYLHGAILIDAEGFAAMADDIAGAEICLAEPAPCPTGHRPAGWVPAARGFALASLIRPYDDARSGTPYPSEATRAEREAQVYVALLRLSLRVRRLDSEQLTSAFYEDVAARGLNMGLALDQDAMVGLAISLRDREPSAVPGPVRKSSCPQSRLAPHRTSAPVRLTSHHRHVAEPIRPTSTPTSRRLLDGGAWGEPDC